MRNFKKIIFWVLLCVYFTSACDKKTATKPAELEGEESYGLILLIDGAHGGIWKTYAAEGKLPNTKRIFMDGGTWVDHATTVFPSITGAGLPSVLTGNVPGRHGIVSLYFFDRIKREYPVLYVALEAFEWNDWLSPNVKTIWEHFEGPDDTLAIGPALSRGADTVISFLWGYEYKAVESYQDDIGIEET